MKLLSFNTLRLYPVYIQSTVKKQDMTDCKHSHWCLVRVTERPAPPASQAAVDGLHHAVILPSDVAPANKCPVCLLPFDVDEEVVLMPCKHRFHDGCIVPWLKKTNSCPVCRYELPTDDPDYESYRKEKVRLVVWTTTIVGVAVRLLFVCV